ncbi:hypothetical protein ANN_19474 [Periplaneta americana]|uniref:alkaline phosphatase n=1 Tax=Periplaneta americana TaxID=6978 RepID=A0ABQ8SAD2_PERAM|nr:hypothetical protein ANN_19474 [Periplaneta americana]
MTPPRPIQRPLRIEMANKGNTYLLTTQYDMEKTALTNLMLTLAMTVVFGVPVEEVNYWNRYGEKRLHDALNKKDIVGHAKNVIIFIGDGMGMSTITAARIYKGQLSGNNGEEYQLVYEKFPNIGLSKTYNVDKQVF